MLLGGLIKTTLLDFPDTVACTVFTVGCNFRCGYCHNPELVEAEKKLYQTIAEESFWQFLEKRKNQLEGVCITGGEPCLHADLMLFIKKIKSLGLKVKLDTNGSKPEILDLLLEQHLLDYVAMDIKGPLEDYPHITGTNLDTQTLVTSISLIKKKAPQYEFRSTIMPKLHNQNSIHAMGKLIQGARVWVLQNFKSQSSLLSKKFRHYFSFTPKFMKEFQEIGQQYVERCYVRD